MQVVLSNLKRKHDTANGKQKVGLNFDSGSVCSILNESLATQIINNSSPARWLTIALANELKRTATKLIPVICMI